MRGGSRPQEAPPCDELGSFYIVVGADVYRHYDSYRYPGAL
jgi:hypothetical protein